MIRINLMPNAIRPKQALKSDSRQLFKLGVGIVLLSMFVCWAWWGMLTKERDILIQEQFRKTASINMLYEQAQTEMALEHKLQTRRGTAAEDPARKFLPIRALSGLSYGVGQLDLWLESLSIDHKSVLVDGQAWTREDIWQFVDNLEQHEALEQIERIVTRPYKIGKNDRYQFSLQIMLKS